MKPPGDLSNAEQDAKSEQRELIRKPGKKKAERELRQARMRKLATVIAGMVLLALILWSAGVYRQRLVEADATKQTYDNDRQ